MRYACASGENAFDDLSGDVSEPEIAAVVAKYELFMIQAEEVEHGCVKIRDGDRVFCCMVADLVGLAVAGAAPYPATRHPSEKPVGVVVPAATPLGNGLFFPGTYDTIHGLEPLGMSSPFRKPDWSNE